MRKRDQRAERGSTQQFFLKGPKLLRGFLVSAVLLVLLAGATALAEVKKGGAPEPTVITSQSLTTDNKAKTALFEVNVVAKKGEMTMFADKMLVYYAEEKGASNIKKIEAEGNVKLVKGARVVTSRFATYFAEPREHVIFTGEPRASEGENVVTGTKMTYYMNDDNSVVENSKVFLAERKDGGAEGPKQKKAP